MSENKTEILLIGIGNNGRRDDGLGWAFLDGIARILPENWAYEYRYQLQIEDAELISNYREVYFVDADRRNHPGGFKVESLKPLASDSFTSHKLSAQMILYLCREIYGHYPCGKMIGISGKDFRLNCGLSTFARENLKRALSYFNEIVAKESQVLEPAK